MTVEEALVKVLQDHAGVATAVADRVYPKRLPQDPRYPAIAYQRVTTPRVMSHDGPSGLALPAFQFFIFDRTYKAAKAVAEIVRPALDGYRGVVGGGGGVDINGAFVEDEGDGYDDELQVFWYRLDVMVMHNE